MPSGKSYHLQVQCCENGGTCHMRDTALTCDLGLHAIAGCFSLVQSVQYQQIHKQRVLVLGVGSAVAHMC